MKKSNAIAYLRQLCCSGLNKELLCLQFIHAVQTVVPSSNSSFALVDENVIPLSLMSAFINYDLDSAIVALNYLSTEKRNACFVQWFKQHPVLVDPDVFDESFYMTDAYDLLFRVGDQHHLLWALARSYGKPVGMLGLYRSRQQKPFNQSEQALCTQLLPYLAHALQAPVVDDIQYAANGSPGMIILDTQGSILYQSQEAKHLLYLAGYQVFTRDMHSKEVVLFTKLAQLCRNLEAIFRGQSAAPPSWCFDSPCGRFTFHAYWLNGQNNEPGGLIGMTVEHQEPTLLKILRALQNLPLSPTQKEVAALLAQGFSNEKIGERLHIKLSTVKDHVGKVFIKLDINRREELLPKLLALEDANQIVKVL